MHGNCGILHISEHRDSDDEKNIMCDEERERYACTVNE